MSASPLRDRRLLVVEDEYMLALYLCESLEQEGAQVLGPVASVADALELIDATPAIDGAVLDVNLGGEKVFPVADRLLARSVPFLFASGYDRGVLPPRFDDTAFCIKPVDADMVSRVLARVM